MHEIDQDHTPFPVYVAALPKLDPATWTGDLLRQHLAPSPAYARMTSKRKSKLKEKILTHFKYQTGRVKPGHQPQQPKKTKAHKQWEKQKARRENKRARRAAQQDLQHGPPSGQLGPLGGIEQASLTTGPTGGQVGLPAGSTSAAALTQPRQTFPVSNSISYNKLGRDVDQMQLFKLHQYLHTNPEQCWVVDFEFASMKDPFLAIPYEISVRNIDGSSVFTSLIDWGCSATDLVDAISQTWNGGSVGSLAARRKSFLTSFRKHYGHDTTRGMTVADIRLALWDAGFQHDKFVLSWSTSTDLKLLYSIMYDQSISVFRYEVSPVQQDVNIRALLVKMLIVQSQETKLGAAHALLCPGSHVKHFHTAHEDTLATCEIIGVMASALPVNEIDRMGAEVEAGRYIL